ncbi:MAG: hypothetical protein K0R18_472 [Bacillales bacterium]|jgi:hypothetical protein|nr:hypothetical protein [Bacillales bacterium]
MDRKGNLAIICDIRENKPVGVICSCHGTGDVAYSTEDNLLMETLNIILDHKMFLLNEEKVDNKNMIHEETIDVFDSYYLMALNYALPFPWRILGVTPVNGDVEEIANEAYNKLKQGGVNFE